MDQEMTFSLSYEQLTRFAERRIRECNLDSQGAIYGVRLENGKYPTLRLFFVRFDIDIA